MAADDSSKGWKIALGVAMIGAAATIIAAIITRSGNGGGGNFGPHYTTPTSQSASAPEPPTPTADGTTSPTVATPHKQLRLIRNDPNVVLQRYWGLDLDTGEQSKNSYQRGIDVIDGGLSFGVASFDLTMGLLNKGAQPEDCLKPGNRVEDVAIWLSSPGPPIGQSFCVGTDMGNIAITKLLAVDDSPEQTHWNIQVYAK